MNRNKTSEIVIGTVEIGLIESARIPKGLHMREIMGTRRKWKKEKLTRE